MAGTAIVIALKMLSLNTLHIVTKPFVVTIYLVLTKKLLSLLSDYPCVHISGKVFLSLNISLYLLSSKVVFSICIEIHICTFMYTEIIIHI